MKMTADQLMKIAGIAPTNTLRARLNEAEGGMKSFEVISVSQLDGGFGYDTVQAADPLGALLVFLDEEGDEEVADFYRDGLQTNGVGRGWSWLGDDLIYIIREM